MYTKIKSYFPQVQNFEKENHGVQSDDQCVLAHFSQTEPESIWFNKLLRHFVTGQ